MCTLTLVPTGKNNFILTFNRDENPNRETSSISEILLNENKFWMPVDSISGGSCIGISEHDFAICLHNGALEKHERNLPYNKSRGGLVKLLLSQKDPLGFIMRNNRIMSDYENCTIFIISYTDDLIISQCVWDGEFLSIETLSQNPFIYSSSTLYNQGMKKNREEFFQNFVGCDKEISPDLMITFHRMDDLKNKPDIFIKRECVETVSTTQIVKKGNNISLKYLDFIKNKGIDIVYIPKKTLIF